MSDEDRELKDQRVVTMMSPSELEAIDDWMFQNRIRSRGEAIRRLCQVSLLVSARMPHVDRILDEIEQTATVLQDKAKEARNQDDKKGTVVALTNIVVQSTILHVNTMELVGEIKTIQYAVNESKSGKSADEAIRSIERARDESSSTVDDIRQQDWLSNEGK